MKRKKCCALWDKGDCPRAEGFSQGREMPVPEKCHGQERCWSAGTGAVQPPERAGKGHDGGTEKARGAFGPALRM